MDEGTSEAEHGDFMRFCISTVYNGTGLAGRKNLGAPRAAPRQPVHVGVQCIGTHAASVCSLATA